jgi:hypothetical protein
MNFETAGVGRRERSTDKCKITCVIIELTIRSYKGRRRLRKNNRPTTREMMLATTRKESRGNAGAVERVESQKQASHSFHEPLGNLAKTGRDSHIPTAPAARADGKVENQKQVSHFPTAPNTYLSKAKSNGGRAIALRPTRRSAPLGQTTGDDVYTKILTSPVI